MGEKNREGGKVMLLIVLGLCAATSVFVAALRRDTLAVHLFGLGISNSVMLLGVIVYIAQMGGMAATEKTFLFLLPEIQRWLQVQPIPMNRLGYVVAVGRTLFPWFLLQVGLEMTMIPWVRRRLKTLRWLTAVIPVLFLVYYYPDVYYHVVRGRLWLITAMIPVSLIWIGLYLVVGLTLMAQEYQATTITFFKRNNGYVLLAALGITALYLLYATKDPAQIYHLFIGEYIRVGVMRYIDPSTTVMGWIILGVCTLLFVVLGSYGMVRYAQLEYAENREDILLRRKFDAAGTGVSVFVHGIKNQLLSSRVLHKKLSRALEAEEPDIEQVRACAGALRELNEGMLARMDELYRTVKNSALSLTPVRADRVAEMAVERFHGKYPEVTVVVPDPSERLVLADPGPLSEALYNLLTNGCEAAAQAGREPELLLSVRGERLWTIFEVRDNGGGIPAELESRIYEPFFTSKNTNYNWGMGLYYVRRIVKSHFGRLRLESRMGDGSSFYIMLPLYDAGRRG